MNLYEHGGGLMVVEYVVKVDYCGQLLKHMLLAFATLFKVYRRIRDSEKYQDRTVLLFTTRLIKYSCEGCRPNAKIGYLDVGKYEIMCLT